MASMSFQTEEKSFIDKSDRGDFLRFFFLNKILTIFFICVILHTLLMIEVRLINSMFCVSF